MTALAVRAWLKDTLTPIGLQVFDQPLAVGPSGDYMWFTRFPSRTNQITFGGAGAIIETDYAPEILVVLTNPSNQYPQHVLDGYVQAIRDILNSAATMVTLTDPETFATSTLTNILEVDSDPAPSNILTATIVRTQLQEYSVRSS